MTAPRHGYQANGTSGGERSSGPAPAELTVRLHRVRLEAATTLRSARETIADREVILVEVVDAAGGVGWGECSALPRPGYTPEYLDGCWALLREILVPSVVAEPHTALEQLAAVPGHPMARSALVGALVDLDLRAQGRSLASVLAEGGPTAARVPSNAVIGIHDDLGELEAAVDRAVAAGHRSVKLKIDPRHDVVPLRAVRRAWPELPLAVDANGSYPDADTAVAAVAELERVAGTLVYVEQPLAAPDLVGTAIVARRSASRIALDESVTGIGEAVTALSLGAVGALDLKPARVGGPLEAMAIGRIMAAEGIPVFCGGMLESGIGRATALAFAAQPVCTLPADLGPSARYHRRDVTAPFELVDGAIDVPDGAGLGVEPDPEILSEVSIDRWRYP
jgi:O-succinylbenzoate synthase